eukprot:TRINITY_DN2316_c0_g1_i1.p2 TRINITY_DN2316_c0_g1~~TRINITY_DN2316_c0_g1_i1.p2  ORF type:complete len:123 (+),score=10.21 TRINITY_DN2316_c0_g1_i1:197-565(+)
MPEDGARPTRMPRDCNKSISGDMNLLTAWWQSLTGPARAVLAVTGASVAVGACVYGRRMYLVRQNELVLCPYSGNGNLTGKWAFLPQKQGTMSITGKGHTVMYCDAKEFEHCPGVDKCRKLV